MFLERDPSIQNLGQSTISKIEIVTKSSVNSNETANKTGDEDYKDEFQSRHLLLPQPEYEEVKPKKGHERRKLKHMNCKNTFGKSYSLLQDKSDINHQVSLILKNNLK